MVRASGLVEIKFAPTNDEKKLMYQAFEYHREWRIICSGLEEFSCQSVCSTYP
jgi:hypothetical protein